MLRAVPRAALFPARHRPLDFVQATLAPLYVPIIFGRKWPPAISVLILAYLSAIPRPFFNATSRTLRTLNKHNWVRWNFLFPTYFTIAIPTRGSWNFTGAALALCRSHLATPPIHAPWATDYSFKSMQLKAAAQHG